MPWGVTKITLDGHLLAHCPDSSLICAILEVGKFKEMDPSAITKTCFPDI